MSKLVPLLYHRGNKVTVRPYIMVAEVLMSVRVGETYLCPHCGYQTTLRAGCGSYFAYYLDIPHPNADCCTPFRHLDLLRYHDVNEHSFSSYIHYIKKQGTR